MPWRSIDLMFRKGSSISRDNLASRIREFNGIFRIKLVAPKGDVANVVHCYLIQKSENVYVLIDSGWRSTAPELIQAIREEFGERIKIEALILTHLHPDHYGGAGMMVEFFSPTVQYHQAEALVNDRQYSSNRVKAMVGMFATPEQVAEFQEFEALSSVIPVANMYVTDGAAIETASGRWSVIHTPGHTPGHICLFDREKRVVISGDHLLPEETSNVGFYQLDNYNPLKSYLQSLSRISVLLPRIVLPAHGEPFTDVKTRVAELFDHHKKRLRQVFDELQEGVQSVTEVTSHISWSKGSFKRLESFDMWLAISETFSHLEFLRGCGVLTRKEKPDPVYALIADDWRRVEKEIDELTG